LRMSERSLPLQDHEVYERIGEGGFACLVGAFYRRVAADDVLGPMYPKEHLPAAEERLRLFLIQRFGGPSTYSDCRGHPRLRMRHAPFDVDGRARDRWVELMETAIVESALPDDVVPVLRTYFCDTATFMINRP
jgi:hemoglobin